MVFVRASHKHCFATGLKTQLTGDLGHSGTPGKVPTSLLIFVITAPSPQSSNAATAPPTLLHPAVSITTIIGNFTNNFAQIGSVCLFMLDHKLTGASSVPFSLVSNERISYQELLL